MLKHALVLICTLLLPTLASAANTTEETTKIEECLAYHGDILNGMLNMTPALFFGLDGDHSNDTPSNSQGLDNLASAITKAQKKDCASEVLAKNMAMLISSEDVKKAAGYIFYGIHAETTKEEAICKIASHEIAALKSKAPRRYRSSLDEVSSAWYMAIEVRKAITGLDFCLEPIATSFVGE